MKIPYIGIIRVLFTLFLIWMVYKGSFLATAVCFFLIFLKTELEDYKKL